jgi:hypothetical protein
MLRRLISLFRRKPRASASSPRRSNSAKPAVNSPRRNNTKQAATNSPRRRAANNRAYVNVNGMYVPANNFNIQMYRRLLKSGYPKNEAMNYASRRR